MTACACARFMPMTEGMRGAFDSIAVTIRWKADRRARANHVAGKRRRYLGCRCCHTIPVLGSVAESQLGSAAVTGDERVALRYAVAFEPGKYGPEFSRDAAYAGPHLLVVADGIQNMSSPDSPSKIAIGKLRYLDAPAESSDLTISIENGLAGLRETFRQLLEGDPCWMGTGTVLTAMLWQDIHAVIAHVGDTRAYMLRDNELTQLTHDHTIRQVLLDEGRISPGDPEFDFEAFRRYPVAGRRIERARRRYRSRGSAGRPLPSVNGRCSRSRLPGDPARLPPGRGGRSAGGRGLHRP
jgi:Protein phosphatase 2C